ncbi:MAG: hypothetical protein OWS74_04165 [Firmicutes bacterium]|nr:hypothetical protein [Bacillota bacterium]
MGKILSEETKYLLSQRMGIQNLVGSEGWGAVSSRDCGNLVKEAVRLAEEQLTSSTTGALQ